MDDTAAEKDYPKELLDAHYIEDSRLHVPVHDVLVSLEALLEKKGIFQVSDRDTDIPPADRVQSIGDYIRPRSQKELYEELQAQDESAISSGAKHLDPEWKPRTESTYETLKLFTSIMNLDQSDMS